MRRSKFRVQGLLELLKRLNLELLNLERAIPWDESKPNLPN